MKIDDAVKFIRAQGVQEMDDDQLVLLIKRCISNHGFGWTQNTDGTIRALYLGKWVKPFTVFKVYLLLGRGGMLGLMKEFKKKFPLLETVITGRHKKKQNTLRSEYSDETVEVEYHPNKFKLID
jgi:hypothetical protein